MCARVRVRVRVRVRALDLSVSYHGDEIVKKAWVVPKFVGQQLAKRSLKHVRVGRWHAIPPLAGSKMHVVDAVQEVVLDMPAEGREEHASIQPRHADARNALQVLEHGLWHARQHVEVEPKSGVGVCWILGKPTAKNKKESEKKKKNQRERERDAMAKASALEAAKRRGNEETEHPTSFPTSLQSTIKHQGERRADVHRYTGT